MTFIEDEFLKGVSGANDRAAAGELNELFFPAMMM